MSPRFFEWATECHFDEHNGVISTSASEEKSKPFREDLSLREISRFARNDERAGRLAITRIPVDDY